MNFYLLPVDYLLSAGVKAVIYSGQLDIICAAQGVRVCACLCVCMCMCVCVCACVHAFVYLRVCVCMCVSACVCVHAIPMMPGYVFTHKFVARYHGLD